MKPDDEWRRRLHARTEGALRRVLHVVEPDGDGYVLVDGRRLLNLSSNDYLGLASDARLREAAAASARRYGVSVASSRLVCGTTAEHEALEAEYAAWVGAQSALAFSSGSLANLGALPALAGEGGGFASDALNHASLIDGMRLGRAVRRIYAHADAGDARRALAACGPARRWLVTESVFSMDGDLAPLETLSRAATDSNAGLYVDEAHATGLLGPVGAGACSEAGVRPDVLLGTFGKALGSFGACIAGGADLRAFLVNEARAFVYTTAMPPPIAAAARAAIRAVRQEPERRQRVLAIAARLRSGLRDLGLQVPEGRAAIVSVIVGDAGSSLAWGEGLALEGMHAVPIRPPTVPAGTARIRLGARATWSDSDVSRIVEAFRRVRDRTMPGHAGPGASARAP